MKIYQPILFFLIVPLISNAQVMLKKQAVLMGSQFEIIIVEKDSSLAHIRIKQAIDEINRIENLISEWNPYTQVSRLNQNAGIKPVKVDSLVFNLTKRAIEYSKITNGAFDISIAALDKIWKFDGSMTQVPQSYQLKQSIEKVGYENIMLDSTQQTIYLAKVGMKIGFGSIGKGYAADQGRILLQSLGVTAGIVNASGDLSTWGTQPNGDPWKIGIINPFKKLKIKKTLKLYNSAVATSGSYEKFAEIKGKRYSHIINPKTGMPATGLTSVTVYGPSAEIANALSTSIMVMGWKKGKKLLKIYPDYRVYGITDKGRTLNTN